MRLHAHSVLTVFHVQKGRIDVEGDESQAVSEDFVGDDASIAPYVHAFYTHRRYLQPVKVVRLQSTVGTYLGDENTSEGIGNGGVDADEIKLDGAIRETFDSDGQSLTSGE